jgi:hypothetical protein
LQACKLIDSLTKKRLAVTLGTTLLTLVVILVVGVIPVWPFSKKWGPYPAVILAVILIILLLLVVSGKIPV